MSSGDGPGTPPRVTARQAWPVQLVALGSEPVDHVDRRTTPEERLAMVWTLTVEAWSLSGRPIPAYSRIATPMQLRPSDRRRPETTA